MMQMVNRMGGNKATHILVDMLVLGSAIRQKINKKIL